MTPDITVALATGYAAAHVLRRLTISVIDLDGRDCVVDRTTNTVHVRPGLNLQVLTTLITAGIRELCKGLTVVVAEDEIATVATTLATTACGAVDPSPARPSHLRLVSPS